MNEFTEQFVLESRELIEQASSALGSLEEMPDHSERLDALFRAFHTLKGGASIVDFSAMEQTVHAVEDELSQLRKQRLPISDALIADGFACLDQVARWLDRMEGTGEIPADAAEEAEDFIARLGEGRAGVGSANTSKGEPPHPNWLASLLASHPESAPRAKTALRFVPHPDCFLRGEDPLAGFAAWPDLLTFDVKPLNDSPSLDAFDPFQCGIVITALTSCSSSEVRDRLRTHAEESEVISLAADITPKSVKEGAVSDIARKLLEAQLLLLERCDARNLMGHVSSASRVAGNVFRRMGQNARVDGIEQATKLSLAERDAVHLRKKIAEGLRADAVQSGTSLVGSVSKTQTTSQTLRVNSAQIDELVRLAGELTVIKNALGHSAKIALQDDSPLASALKSHHSALDHITSELQRTAVAMRVLPLRTVLQRFTRVVREMAATLGKPTRLVLEGGDTEADKAIVEMLFEPLLHVVRNAMDHGIESSSERITRGKPEVATVRMSATRQADHVVVTVEDDGAGIDPVRIRNIAVERGVVNAEAVVGMSESDIVDLIFAPGFSTASTVTEVSGRGVGMDAVRSAVARLGGKVAIESVVGKGTSVSFTLPYSVLVTHVMTVEAEGQMFGIPLDNIVETVSVSAGSISGVGAARAIVRRNRTVPIFDLGNILRVRNSIRNKSESLVVIATISGQLGGIEVDRLGERMEVMLKPLEGMLSGLSGITGTTILGDGRVLLVLDLEGVMQ